MSVIDFSKKKKTKEASKLVWGRPFFGLYDRYGAGAGNHDSCWAFSGPGFERNQLVTSNLDYRGGSSIRVKSINVKRLSQNRNSH
jgi:hypothetical protein